MPALTVALSRLLAQGSLLAGIAGIFVALVLFGDLSLVAGIVGFLAVCSGRRRVADRGRHHP